MGFPYAHIAPANRAFQRLNSFDKVISLAKQGDDRFTGIIATSSNQRIGNGFIRVGQCRRSVHVTPLSDEGQILDSTRLTSPEFVLPLFACQENIPIVQTGSET